MSVLFGVLLPNLVKKRQWQKHLLIISQTRFGKECLRELRKMSPSEFERYIADLFQKFGYQTNVVGKSHDGGLDVEIEKDGKKGYIQCKKYKDKKVDVHAVRDFYGAIADISNGENYFITTSLLTLEAKKYSEDKPFELVDGSKLIEYILLTEKEAEDISHF